MLGWETGIDPPAKWQLNDCSAADGTYRACSVVARKWQTGGKLPNGGYQVSEFSLKVTDQAFEDIKITTQPVRMMTTLGLICMMLVVHIARIRTTQVGLQQTRSS